MAMSYQNRLGDFARAFAAQQALVPQFVSSSVARDVAAIDEESEAVLREMERRRLAAQAAARRAASAGRIAGAIGSSIGSPAGALVGTFEDELADLFKPSEYQMLRKDLGLPAAGPYYGS
jgi:hypothetical protein|tara:strand:+ start:17 stop:376 length:360 start_codon:yes stop_codon:yes gene_type:complete